MLEFGMFKDLMHEALHLTSKNNEKLPTHLVIIRGMGGWI